MNPIRIAIATADGVSVCDHLARSQTFVILEVAEGRATSRPVRDRDGGQCGNHKSFVELAEGCQAVICGGIGQGAFDSLKAHGIEPLVLAQGCTIEEALAGYIAGTLTTTGERACLCH
jgi:predicted Fe-Mo cluster-binding NifX family protein